MFDAAHSCRFVPSVADDVDKISSTVMIHVTCDEYLPVTGADQHINFQLQRPRMEKNGDGEITMQEFQKFNPQHAKVIKEKKSSAGDSALRSS